MGDMGTDRLGPAAAVPDRLGSPGRREDGKQARRQPPVPDPKDVEGAEDLEVPTHEIDSLA